jgi:ABC-type transport system substrate-binding protein
MCRRWPLATPVWLIALLLSHGALAPAQQTPAGRIIDREPFDRMTLDKENENKVLLLKPVPLPDRRLPEKPKPTDKLRVRMLDTDQEYEVAWKNIERLELYEQIVLAEANQLAAEGNFDAAYDYFTFLLELYPSTEGLAQARQSYLYLSARAAFSQQKYHEALAILEELWAQNAAFRPAEGAATLLTGLGNIADRLIAQYVAKDDYRSARAMLKRLETQYQASQEPFAVRWRGELASRAAQERDRARAHLEAGRFIEAYDACAAMRAIWPEVEGAAELSAEVARRHPLVLIGVEHPALSFDTRSLINPAARRSGRLVERGLLEFAGPGPEGGRYVCPLGTVEQSVDGLQLIFELRANAGAPAYDLSRLLLSWANEEDPGYRPVWARSLASVRVTNVNRVTAEFKAPRILPQAMLQGGLARAPRADQQGQLGSGSFYVFSHNESMTRYSSIDSAGDRPAGRLAEVGERLYADPQRALMALSRGEIDVLDRVFPADIPLVKSDPELTAAPLEMPTTHLILFRDRHPYLANRTFRRALVCGINRELILSQGLLRGQELPGFRVISAPFPAPSASGDAQAYAYDQQIAPRAYDPRLALTLRVLAQNELKSAFEKQQKTVPALTPLVLGHPADETSRIACRAIARQWDQIGVKCTLAEFPPGEFDDRGACDLIYVQAATWEPVVDAQRLLGPNGLAPAQSDFIQLTLRQIDRATNWQQARDRFRQLHRLLHEDVTVIPLWQTHDHYAYRKSLQGLQSPRISLYENIDQWRTASGLAQAGAVPAGSSQP